MRSLVNAYELFAVIDWRNGKARVRGGNFETQAISDWQWLVPNGEWKFKGGIA
jgi:hypothetical protein